MCNLHAALKQTQQTLRRARFALCNDRHAAVFLPHPLGNFLICFRRLHFGAIALTQRTAKIAHGLGSDLFRARAHARLKEIQSPECLCVTRRLIGKAKQRLFRAAARTRRHCAVFCAGFALGFVPREQFLRQRGRTRQRLWVGSHVCLQHAAPHPLFLFWINGLHHIRLLLEHLMPQEAFLRCDRRKNRTFFTKTRAENLVIGV